MEQKSRFYFRSGLFGLFALIFSQCADERIEKTLLSDKEYLPLSIGTFQVYNVVETTFINGPEGDTKIYQLKTEVVDSFPSAGSDFTYVMYRSIRISENAPWIYKDTWTTTFTSREAIVQEGNISYVKLVNPLSANRAWNGNAYNNGELEEYSISLFAKADTISGKVFDDVVEITHRNDVDRIIGNDIRKETYGKGIGLLYRKVETIEYCTTDACRGKQQILKGTRLEQVIKEYGKN